MDDVWNLIRQFKATESAREVKSLLVSVLSSLNNVINAYANTLDTIINGDAALDDLERRMRGE